MCIIFTHCTIGSATNGSSSGGSVTPGLDTDNAIDTTATTPKYENEKKRKYGVSSHHSIIIIIIIIIIKVELLP